MSTSKKLFFSSIIFLIVFGFAEAAAYFAGRMLEGKAVFYRPTALDEVSDYFARRDPVLGWPSPSEFGGKRYDRSGSRPIPGFPEPGEACVSIYGDSFTYGDGVTDEEAWSNQLSRLVGCRVANYGVGGYGSDQATIRFEQNVDDEAPVVVLGHLSENILRNVNQYRKLLAAGGGFGLKPRFALRPGGELEVLPLQVDTPEDFVRFVERPEEHLGDDYFAPGGASGVRRQSFPYTLSMLLALRHYHVRAKLAGLPAYTEFYQPDHPAEGLELTTRILERFARTARSRGKLVMLQIIPTGLDLLEYQKSGHWTYQPLLDRTRQLDIDVVDLGTELMKTIGDGDPCAIYIRCNNHFNAAGNELLAREVLRALDARRIRRLAAWQGRWPYEIAELTPIAPPVAAAPPQ